VLENGRGATLDGVEDVTNLIWVGTRDATDVDVEVGTKVDTA